MSLSDTMNDHELIRGIEKIDRDEFQWIERKCNVDE